jgi:hypothetical protein
MQTSATIEFREGEPLGLNLVSVALDPSVEPALVERIYESARLKVIAPSLRRLAGEGPDFDRIRAVTRAVDGAPIEAGVRP